MDELIRHHVIRAMVIAFEVITTFPWVILQKILLISFLQSLPAPEP